jgi:hypothetical protein
MGRKAFMGLDYGDSQVIFSDVGRAKNGVKRFFEWNGTVLGYPLDMIPGGGTL